MIVHCIVSEAKDEAWALSLRIAQLGGEAVSNDCIDLPEKERENHHI